MIAYIFVKYVPGQEREVRSKIKRLPNAVEVSGAMGRIDIFKISTKKGVDLHTNIASIRDVSSLVNTSTFTVIQGSGATVDYEK